MTISVTYEPQPTDFSDAYREVASRGSMRVINYAFGLGIPLLQTILILSDPAVRADPGRLVRQLLPWWTMFPALYWGVTFMLRRWMLRRFVKDDATQQGTQVRRLDADGLHIRGPGMSASIGWSVLRSAVETRRFFLLFQTRDCAYFLPKRAMDRDLVVQTRAVLAERLPSRARLMTD